MGTVTTAMSNTFKEELLKGVHNFSSQTFKMALIKASPTDSYGAGTKSYANSAHTSAGDSLTTGTNDEATGTNYSSGGQALDSTTVTLSGSTAFIDFSDEVFSNVTISTSGCVIYNDTASGKPVVCVISFGGTVTATAGNLTITMPTADASNAIIRIA